MLELKSPVGDYEIQQQQQIGEGAMELADACATSCNWDDPALRDKDEAGKRANTLSTISWISGGVALAGGVALYFVGRSKIEVVPIEGGAAVAGTF